MKEEILFKAEVLRGIRESLHELGFVELTTPIARRADCRFRPRPVVDLLGKRYLRESMSQALRHNLQYLPRIYELGPCFRLDSSDRTHASEFTMLDLYAAGESMDFLLDLAERLVLRAYHGKVERLSIADAVRDAFGVDLATESEMVLRDRLLDAYRLPAHTSLYDAVEVYVARELEARTLGRCVMLHDFPLRTEVCAKRREGTVAILNRFEIYIDGVEVVHGYEDEDDLPAFVERATEISFFNAEQRRVNDEIQRGIVPVRSVGFGIGIERLCMACRPGTDIHLFVFSPDF